MKVTNGGNMKQLNQTQQKTLDVEINMLKGNLCRMCVTKDRKELDDMYKYATQRISRIYVLNQQKFEEKDK